MMEEISMKSNFRFKALVVALITTILTATCSTAFGFSLASLFGNKDASEPYLNRKVYFTGDTHYYSDGSGLKLFNKGKDVRKSYSEDKPGCGIISIISKGKAYPYYITGEGWIKGEQIITEMTTRFISLDFNKTEDGYLNSVLHIDGEYVEVVSDNNAIVRYEEGKLIAEGNGSTTVTIHPGNGKEDIELLAIVADGNIELNIPEKSVSADLNNATVAFVDKKVKVEGNGHAEASLLIEDGAVSVTASGNGQAKLLVEDKEIARIDAEGAITATADIANKELRVEGTAKETLTILDKFAVALEERANAKIDMEHVEAGVGGTAYVNDKEVADGNASIAYQYGAEDPTGSVDASILGNQVVNMQDKTIPVSKVISGLQGLISRVR